MCNNWCLSSQSRKLYGSDTLIKKLICYYNNTNTFIKKKSQFVELRLVGGVPA